MGVGSRDGRIRNEFAHTVNRPETLFTASPFGRNGHQRILAGSRNVLPHRCPARHRAIAAEKRGKGENQSTSWLFTGHEGPASAVSAAAPSFQSGYSKSSLSARCHYCQSRSDTDIGTGGPAIGVRIEFRSARSFESVLFASHPFALRHGVGGFQNERPVRQRLHTDRAPSYWSRSWPSGFAVWASHSPSVQ